MRSSVPCPRTCSCSPATGPSSAMPWPWPRATGGSRSSPRRTSATGRGRLGGRHPHVPAGLPGRDPADRRGRRRAARDAGPRAGPAARSRRVRGGPGVRAGLVCRHVPLRPDPRGVAGPGAPAVPAGDRRARCSSSSGPRRRRGRWPGSGRPAGSRRGPSGRRAAAPRRHAGDGGGGPLPRPALHGRHGLRGGRAGRRLRLVHVGPERRPGAGGLRPLARRPIGRATLVLVHCNSYADGYWVDVTRTYSLGEPDDRRRAMYEAVFAARAAALAAIRPGSRAADVDRAAREVLAGARLRPAVHAPDRPRRRLRRDRPQRPSPAAPEVGGRARGRHGLQRRAGDLPRRRLRPAPLRRGRRDRGRRRGPDPVPVPHR